MNAKIKGGEKLVQTITGLEHGLNLVRFIAVAELDGQWVTNTVAIHRR